MGKWPASVPLRWLVSCGAFFPRISDEMSARPNLAFSDPTQTWNQRFAGEQFFWHRTEHLVSAARTCLAIG